MKNQDKGDDMNLPYFATKYIDETFEAHAYTEDGDFSCEEGDGISGDA
jgi:hypothetical protein